MWDDDPSYVEGYYGAIRWLLGSTVVVAILTSIYLHDFEPLLYLARIALIVGAVLAGYASIIWLGGQFIRCFVRRRRGDMYDL